MTTAEIVSIVIPSAVAILSAGVVLGSFKALKEDMKDVKRMTIENTIAIARMQGSDDAHAQAPAQLHIFPSGKARGH